MANFDIAYKITSGNEGGYANVDGDTGAETYCGISRKWFPKWTGWQLVDAAKPLKHGQIIKSELLPKFVRSFYKNEFWDKIGGDKIEPQALANQVYDMAVNASVATALKLLKQS